MSSPCLVVYACVFIASPAAALIFQFNGSRLGEGELHRDYFLLLIQKEWNPCTGTYSPTEHNSGVVPTILQCPWHYLHNILGTRRSWSSSESV